MNAMKRIGLLIVAVGQLPAGRADCGDWSVFDPLRGSRPPAVVDPDWQAPIDAFIYDGLTKAGLRPAPVADRRIWLRRVALDLHGLPPAPEEMQDFLADDRPDAVVMAEIVDRYLASPRYGERWARHWLDVVRYADSDGFAIDAERLQLWRYRDYVIRSWNQDLPFDQFVREQLAGDELVAGELEAGDRRSAGLVAIGYYRLGPWEADNMTPEHRRQDYLNDVTTNIGSAFLGLTIGCARCHDHKYDPISQLDFYRLQAFIAPIKHEILACDFMQGELTPAGEKTRGAAIRDREETARQLDSLLQELRQRIARVIDAPPELVEDSLLDRSIKDRSYPVVKEQAERVEALRGQLANQVVEQRLDAKVVAIRNPAGEEKVPESHLLRNGDVFDPADRVTPGFPATSSASWSAALSQRAETLVETAAGRRGLLAAWMTDVNNPIPPRVFANRVWQFHFGSGLVATTNDLGNNGSGPSHPELLDYLAERLRQGGWSLKTLHRELLLSRTYRMGSRHPAQEACSRIDPANRLCWRAPLRRLDAESLRDALLAVSGRLQREMGGPGIYEALPSGMETKLPFFDWNASEESQRCRRSIYMFQRRNLVHPLVEAFDGPEINLSCELRRTSVTAPQALALFNGSLTHECCHDLAAIIRQSSADAERRIDSLYWRALGRAPSPQELAICVGFLRHELQQTVSSSETVAGPREAAGSGDASGTPSDAKWLDLCLAILNSNEFIYLD